MARSIRAAGGRPATSVHNAYGYGLFTGGLGAHYGAERLGCAVIPCRRRHDRAAGPAHRRLRAGHHHGDADAICWRSSTSSTRAGARSARVPRSRIGMFGAEPWTNAMRAEIERRFGHRRARHLRAVRGDGPGRRQRMHRDQGRARRSGRTISFPRSSIPERAPCCRTASAANWCSPRSPRKAMPVIRYRTRDLTRLLPGTARTMRRMERVTGRTDDMLIVRGVNVFPTQIEAVLAQESTGRAALHAGAAPARAAGQHDVRGGTRARGAAAAISAVQRRASSISSRRCRGETRVRLSRPAAIERSAGQGQAGARSPKEGDE